MKKIGPLDDRDLFLIYVGVYLGAMLTVIAALIWAHFM